MASSSPSIRVCGIGASAGGVEALQQLFSALPADLGLAYVVVLHLAPDRKSELEFVLGRWTSMPVRQVIDHETVKLLPDHVYVIAPDRQLEMTDSSVTARQFDEPRGHRAAIDTFFRSLAAAHGDGFAVVLSGSGSDGALGARAIKARGGLVLVQDPAEAGHGSMPRSVMATGAADLVLPVRELAAQLSELARSKGRLAALLRSDEEPDVVDEDEDRALRAVLDALRKGTGHDFSRYKRATVYRRLARRMQLVQQGTIPEYLTYLRAHPAELSALFDDLLITVTTFFRDAAAWTAFRDHVVVPLVEASEPGEPIRVWVAGCATGEEAYSVAMLFEEEFERRGASRSLLIFASDVDERALAVAREGLYPEAIAADISEVRLQRFFRREDSHYRVVRELRDRVVFATHSVLRDPPFSRMHIVTCRNLLIYFDRDLQEQVMSIFRYACRERGVLFLGASENADEELFQPIDKRHRIFAARAVPDGAKALLPELGGSLPTRATYAMTPRLEPRPQPSEAHMAALEELAPPTVLLDERGNVLHLSASASHFLRQGAGPLARRITDLIRPELRDEAHSLLHRGMAGPLPRLSPFVPVRFNGSTHRVALLCQRRTRQDRVDLLLTFLDAGELEPGAIVEGPVPDEAMRELREKLHQAEQRIEGMRDEHALTFEELRAANEELQSLNEEYRSTTEELETSKEELQSVNEELQTVNHELHLKLEEVSRGQSDLVNLMAATNIATLFLSPSLRIKRYTPSLESLFNIRGRDLDRPIGDLTHALEYPALITDAQQVLKDGLVIEREVASEDGRIFAVRLGPYRSETHEIDGVVLTLVDVSRLKQVERALRDSERRLETELNVLRRLHEMTRAVATAPTLHGALERIVDAAVELHGAEGGAMQLLDRESGQLELTAQTGSRPPRIWSTVDGRSPEASIEVLNTRSIVQVPLGASDTRTTDGPGDAADRGSLQATPLLSRSNELAGVLTVWFDDRHIFHERDTQLGDVLGRLAGELVETRTHQMAISASQSAAAEVRLLLRRLVGVQEEERRRVARDIHDHVGQQMTALRLALSALRLALEPDAGVLPQVERIEARASELDSAIEHVTRNLRPSSIEHLGLPAALHELLNECATASGIDGELEVLPDQHVPALSADTSLNLYRIAQEALHNVQRHAEATSVHVVLDIRPREIRMVIEDDGRGFGEKDPAVPPTGLGLVTMRERALAIGGSLEIESGPGRGVAILVRVPRVDPPPA